MWAGASHLHTHCHTTPGPARRAPPAGCELQGAEERHLAREVCIKDAGGEAWWQVPGRGRDRGKLAEAAVTAPGRAQRRATGALRRAACAPLPSGVSRTGGLHPTPLRLTVLVNLVVNY